jgi:hypothetical protein
MGIDGPSHVVVGAACSVAPEPCVRCLPPVEVADERGKLFAEITDAIRVVLDSTERAPNPFRGDVAAAASYARAYGRAFA